MICIHSVPSNLVKSKIKHLRKTPSTQSFTEPRLQCLRNSFYFLLGDSKADGMLATSLQLPTTKHTKHHKIVILLQHIMHQNKEDEVT